MTDQVTDIEVYDSIEEMKLQSDHQKLTAEEAILKVLDILDMFASISEDASVE